jgi:choice-of-anchor B domain-containing protein
MPSVPRLAICGTVLAIAAFAARISTSATAAPAAFNGFGATVHVGEGEVFVGESNNQFRPGTVYIYRKTGNAWQEATTLQRPAAAVFDGFGSTLALDGSRLFVGAGTEAIHLFTKQGMNWTHTGVVPASAVTGGENVEFGAIAGAGDWLLVGQRFAGGGRGRGGRGRGGQNAPPPPAGKVYAFKRSAAGQYAYHSTLISPEAESAGDGFGASIAVSGATALIGAVGQASRAGVVHEFALDADGAWVEERAFAPQGVGDNEQFGSAISLDGNQAVVTAPGDAGGYGAAYVFRKVQQTGRRGGGGGGGNAGRQGGAGGNFTWQELTRLTQPVGGRGNGFASAIGADATEVWVGATRAGGPGGVFVFSRNDSGFTGDFALMSPDRTDNAAAGQSISVRGNIAAVGATGVNRGGGGVTIYERDASGAWREQPMLMPAVDELPTLTGEERACSGTGKVEMFECGNTELLAFVPPSKLTHDGHTIDMNDIWGWTDPQTGTEWALVGRVDGTTFVDMSKPTMPVAVADLPLTDGARPSSWRDIKVYKDHAYIVSDSAGPHGMQVFDLSRLRDLKPQANGLPSLTTYDVLYSEIASAHNIVINEESGFAYSVGSSAGGTTCGGGLHMIDIREPKAPKFVGCFADTETGRAGTGYSHDAQCVTYRGPDARYKGHEICIGSNENSISVADVTDKANPKALSRATYPNVAYAHQGWFTDDHKYFFLDDESDEGRADGPMKTRTMIWDLADLENPILAKEHLGVAETSDHNLYIQGDYMYQANYKSGLRILNIADPENPREVAFFDTAPYTENNAGYQGAWSVYPFFKSGVIIVNSIEQGLFLVRPADRPIRR